MKFSVVLFTLSISLSLQAQNQYLSNYLEAIKKELIKEWPNNKTINLVFHGHSVPCGYFVTPTVNTLFAYPYLSLAAIKERYSNAVVNVITTSIGGENSEQGCVRFDNEVLTHLPDVIFIDYALNDRSIGLEKAKKAWTKMIERSISKNIKVILMTPTPDLTEDITDDNAILEQHSTQIRQLAEYYKIGIIDSYAIFKNKKKEGENLELYMSQNNHPNELGHEVLKELIIKFF